MDRRFLKGTFLGILALLCQNARGEDASGDLFPESNRIFSPLLADPRQVQDSFRYYRFQGLDVADAAVGSTWGIYRWHAGKGGAWNIQWDVAGMAYSRFLLSSGINEFQTVDFFINIPFEIRHGIFSARVTPFHESSHLGDSYIRRTNDKGFIYSLEGIRNVFSIEPLNCARFYGGAMIPVHGRYVKGEIQSGFEFKTPYFHGLLGRPFNLYVAQDFQSRELVQWNLSSNTELGIDVRASERAHQSLRIHFGYFNGHSQFGQFFSRKEEYLSFGTSLDF